MDNFSQKTFANATQLFFLWTDQIWNTNYNTVVILLLVVSIRSHTSYKLSLHKTCSGETQRIAVQKMSENHRLTLTMKQLKSTAREEFSVGLLAIGRYPSLLWKLEFGHCCPLWSFFFKSEGSQYIHLSPFAISFWQAKGQTAFIFQLSTLCWCLIKNTSPLCFRTLLFKKRIKSFRFWYNRTERQLT